MPGRRLPEREDPFAFQYARALVNYGGSMQFYQTAFPPPEHGLCLEELIFQVIARYIQLLHDKGSAGVNPDLTLGTLWARVWAEMKRHFHSVSREAFGRWRQQQLDPLTQSARKLFLHAREQEKTLHLPRLGYFTALSLVSLISQMVSEYFERMPERLGPLENPARWCLGRALTLALETAFWGEDPQAQAQADPGVRGLLNPMVLTTWDAADTARWEDLALGLTSEHLLPGVNAVLLGDLKTLLDKAGAPGQDLSRVLAEPSGLRALLEHRREQKRLLRPFRQDSDLRGRVLRTNAEARLQPLLDESAESDPELIGPGSLETLLNRPGARKKRFRTLKNGRALETAFARQARLLQRGRKAWFGLTRHELLEELAAYLQRLGGVQAQWLDLLALRRHFGKDSRQALPWIGLKLWRSFELDLENETLKLKRAWEQRRAEIENSFAEGSCFFCAAEGPLFSLGTERRSRVTFFFADLRNSTETTMKLNKDTASYLAPYLTAVNSAANASGGERIYFAGDGFAAHFPRARSAVRAAFEVSLRFSQLRVLASKDHVLKAKAIFQGAEALGFDPRAPLKQARELATAAKTNTPAEVRDFLVALADLPGNECTEPQLRALLAKVASAHSMPRVDVGIALTSGELFFALVGEPHETKIPIVISPQLTQAARLSGSAEAVKQHLDANFPQPFPFHVYAWDQRLYNRGIAATEDIVQQLAEEVELKPLRSELPELKGEELLSYPEPDLKRRLVLRKNRELVRLKGIETACAVYEVATPNSFLDKEFGSR